MSIRRKIIVLVGVMLTGSVAALLMDPGAKPVVMLSRGAVLENRGVAIRSLAPGWSSFTRANLRIWPTLARMRLTFRIDGIREESISIATIYPDGTREEPSHPVTVRFRAY